MIYGKSVRGGRTYIGSGCLIGYPRRTTLRSLIEHSRTLRESLETGEGAKIGGGCIIRPDSTVYEGAVLGDEVETGHSIIVREMCEIGRRTKIGTFSVIDGSVVVGESVSIQSGVYLPPGSVVGDNCFLGPYSTFTNDLYPPSPRISGVKLGRNVVVGARAVLIAGVKVGDNSIIAAGAVVTRDVPPETVVVGVPAKKAYTRKEYEEKRGQNS